MAQHKTTEEYEKDALKLIKDYSLYFIQDVCSMLGINRQTFYNHGLDKLDSIRTALATNNIKKRLAIRRNWEQQTENATMQVALYKLLAEPEERRRLSQSYQDITTDGEKIGAVIDWSKVPTDALATIIKAAEEDQTNQEEEL